MFIVKYSAGYSDDVYERNVFVTDDEKLASDWCNRFNRIAKERLEYVKMLENEGNLEEYQKRGRLLFMYDFWYFDEPHASFQKIEVRH